jgi:predicted MFS family arabinose efflux permease
MSSPAGSTSTDAEPLVPKLRENRDFKLLWSGGWLSFFGARMAAMCYPLLTLALTGGSATAAGVVGFAALLPNLVMQLPAGALVDRWDRRKVMLSCGIGRFVALGSLVTLLFLDSLRIPFLIGVVLVDGSFAIFYALAEQGAVRTLVHPRHLGTAISQNGARGRAAALLGGPVGTGLFSYSRWLPFLVAVCGFLITTSTVFFIKNKCQTERKKTELRLLTEIREGTAWLWRQRFLRVATTLVSFSGVVFQVVTLAVILVLIEGQHLPESTVGLVLGISGVGGLVGALSASWWMRRLSLPVLVIGGFVSWALLMPLMAFVVNPLLMGALFAAMNLIGAVFNVAAVVYQVRVTPDEMQGRAAGTANLIVSGTSALGALGSGFLLDRTGGPAGILVASGLMALVAIVAAVSPAIRNPEPDPAAGTAGPVADAEARE